jgi:hypothetical protein
MLLSMMAIAAFFFHCHDGFKVATTEQDALHLSRVFAKGALDVLDYSRRNTSGTMEDIQAYIHMFYVFFHLDGPSARGRAMSTAATSLAIELRLHRLDADRSSSSDNSTGVRALIDREVKRRVFWSIASTDW